MKSPNQNNPRALSIRHGISTKRVEAIIRLKSHEYKWKQVSPSSSAIPLRPSIRGRPYYDDTKTISL